MLFGWIFIFLLINTFIVFLPINVTILLLVISLCAAGVGFLAMKDKNINFPLQLFTYLSSYVSIFSLVMVLIKYGVTLL